MTEIVPRFTFDTEGLPPASRLAAWASLLPWFEVGAVRPEEDFHVRAEAWLIGAMVLSVTAMPAVWLARTQALIIADGRLDYAVIAGAAPWTLRLGDAPPSVVEPGSICVLDNTQPFRVEHGGGEFTILNIPRPMLSHPRLPPDLHGALLRHTLALILGDFMLGLRARLTTLGAAEAPAVEKALADLLVSCLVAGAQMPAATTGDASLLQQTGRFIDRNLADALTVADVARAMGVSRSRLYRIFEPVGGVQRFILRRRLHSARVMLLQPSDRPLGIAEVAHATGFASATHFSRLFKARFGVSPSQARRDDTLWAEDQPHESADARRFQSWFLTPIGGGARTRRA